MVSFLIYFRCMQIIVQIRGGYRDLQGSIHRQEFKRGHVKCKRIRL